MAFHSETCTLPMLLILSFLSSPWLPSTAPVPTPAYLFPLHTAPHHPRTSSAKLLLFCCFPKGLKADPWWRPNSTANGSLVPAAHLTTVSHLCYMSLTSLVYFAGTPLSRMHQNSSSLWTMSYVFQVNAYTV